MGKTIAIVGGTGAEGMGLALRWARAGEDLIIGSRDPQRAQTAAAQIAAMLGGKAQVRGAGNAEAVAEAEIVVLTVPFSGHAEILRGLKAAFKPTTVLIDTTVPLAAAVGGAPTRTLGLWQGSAAQQAAEIVPKDIKVVAGFQSISATLLEGEKPVDCDVIICTDDEGSREVASALAEKIPGVRAVNGGRLENARIVEQMTAMLITVNRRYKVHGAGLRFTGLPLEEPRR